MRVNKNTVYYSDADLKYRGIYGSQRLRDLIGTNDDPKLGKCCSTITEIKKNRFQRGAEEDIAY
jgi:hypothetical protein